MTAGAVLGLHDCLEDPIALAGCILDLHRPAAMPDELAEGGPVAGEQLEPALPSVRLALFTHEPVQDIEGHKRAGFDPFVEDPALTAASDSGAADGDKTAPLIRNGNDVVREQPLLAQHPVQDFEVLVVLERIDVRGTERHMQFAVVDRHHQGTPPFRFP